MNNKIQERSKGTSILRHNIVLFLTFDWNWQIVYTNKSCEIIELIINENIGTEEKEEEEKESEGEKKTIKLDN